MTVTLGLIGWVALILVALLGFSILRSARRLRRGGFSVREEERRLRDDPRFTEDWVRQLRPSGGVADARNGDGTAHRPPHPTGSEAGPGGVERSRD